jgi:lysophospholipase L1-like esterase
VRRWLFVLVLLGLGFLWGWGVGAYHVFPYEPVRRAKNWLEGDRSEQERPLFVNPDAFTVAEADLLAQGSADVVMLGDSITAAGRWHEWLPGSVVNRGIGGDTVSGVRRRLPEILSRRPHTVFLMVGINDVLSGNRVDQLLPIYDDILGRLHQAGVRAVLQPVLACGARCNEEQRETVLTLNRHLRQLAARHGAVFLDLNARLSDGRAMQPRYTWDGIHLTAEGYRVWLELVRGQLGDSSSR